MIDNFADFFIKKYSYKTRKEIEAEKKSQRVFNEYQQKIINQHIKESDDWQD